MQPFRTHFIFGFVNKMPSDMPLTRHVDNHIWKYCTNSQFKNSLIRNMEIAIKDLT